MPGKEEVIRRQLERDRENAVHNGQRVEIEVFAVGEEEEIRLERIGAKLNNSLLHPGQVPEGSISVGQRASERIVNTVSSVKDERPGLNNCRRREQEEEKGPATKAACKQASDA